MEAVEWYQRHQAIQDDWPSGLRVDPQYGGLDCDTIMALAHFSATEGRAAKVIEVGANESPLCRVLADNGFRTLGVDLRRHDWRLPHNYARAEGDFLEIAPFLARDFDAAVSTSALEHFGLPLYGFRGSAPDYDARACDWVYRLLKPGGRFYVTVPYGREFAVESDWRVYCKRSLQDRIVKDFAVEKKVFFLSGGCDCPDDRGIVKEADADAYDGRAHPHVTVFLLLRKPDHA